ncbi:hypothetical protein [Escherichia coli]|uniref:hypothetical protein n=1 Tax=Escherichia coli TaxID=562 RepID=UPI00388D8301
MDFPDLLSLSRISDLKNVKAYSVRGVTHGVGRFIDKRYGMPNIITFFVENNTLPEIKEINNLCHNKSYQKYIPVLPRHLSTKIFHCSIFNQGSFVG